MLRELPGERRQKRRGSVVPEWGWWEWLPWTYELNSKKCMHNGKKVSWKMSNLELLRPLIMIFGTADRLRGLPIRFSVDNGCACNFWRHSYSSTCSLLWDARWTWRKYTHVPCWQQR
jgi:hypothetical protein